MRIVFIGDQTLQNDNDAVKSVLSSELGRDIWHITHAQVQEGICITREYFVSLVDLISCPQNPVEFVRYVSKENVTKHLIALHESQHNALREELVEAGADYCFSIDSEPENLLQIISKLDRR